MEIKDVLYILWFVFWSIYLGFKGSFLQNWRIFLQYFPVLPRSSGCFSSGMLGRAWNSPRANRDKPPVARNACRRVRAPWRFSSGLDSPRTQMMGIIQRCGGGGFFRKVLLLRLTARWLRCGGLAEELVRSMGTGDYICVTLRGGAPWGFTLREGEGDTYRPFLVSQVKSDRLIVC